ncbi:hypothetical protein [Hoeflea sp.]|uniref:hypothetical protein n=1 Tax=Hoeflea sp. TaxID=1940281 RepID=UPI003B528328
MLPEDDYLRLKPATRETRTIQKIALMALMGCLILLTALVAQAPAGPIDPDDRIAPVVLQDGGTGATGHSPGPVGGWAR